MGGGGFGEGGRKDMGAGNGFGRKWIWQEMGLAYYDISISFMADSNIIAVSSCLYLTPFTSYIVT